MTDIIGRHSPGINPTALPALQIPHGRSLETQSVPLADHTQCRVDGTERDPDDLLDCAVRSPGAVGRLTIGVIAFALILIGLSFWLMLSIKEIRLNHRQANFVDSVTHELKSPIAALQLYLETLRMRSLDPAKRDEFHGIMEGELHRLDQLINQLLEVGRLDNVGEQEQPEDILLPELVGECIQATTRRYKYGEDVCRLQAQPVIVRSQRIVLRMIFSNLIDNAIKYAGDPPRVTVNMAPSTAGKVRIRIINNGPGVPAEDRQKIFRIFYRGGSELERRHKGTGLGLYIVHTLVKKLRGRISVHDRYDGEPGCEFVLDLPGRAADNPVPRTGSALSAGLEGRPRETVS